MDWYKDNMALQAELRREYSAVAELIDELEQQLADERQDCAELALQVAQLEQQLSRYQGGVEVDMTVREHYMNDIRDAEMRKAQVLVALPMDMIGQRVRVLVKGVE